MCHLSKKDQYVCQINQGIAEAVTCLLGGAQFSSCPFWRHWFSFMGTFLPFEIITYATCIWKISCTDSRLSRMPKATAGTSRVVKWTRRKLCTTQYTRNSLCNPLVDLAYILVLRRKVAHFRRRALQNASA